MPHSLLEIYSSSLVNNTPTFLSINLKPTGFCFLYSEFIILEIWKLLLNDVLIRQVTEFMFQNIYSMETGKEHQKGESLWWHTYCTLYKYILCSHLNIVIANCLSGVQYQWPCDLRDLSIAGLAGRHCFWSFFHNGRWAFARFRHVYMIVWTVPVQGARKN